MGRNFDAYFKELLQEMIDEMPCPSKEKAWRQVRKRLTEKQKAKKFILNKYRLINQ